MTSQLKNVRPNCKEILDLKNSWAMSEKEFDFQTESMKILNCEKNYCNLTINILKSRQKLFEEEGLKNSFSHNMKFS